MVENSKIQWCTHTGNLWWGCTKVHEGCEMCYAETLSKRFGDNIWGNDNPRKEIKAIWKNLNRYQRLAKEAGEIHKVFIGSMMDIFEKPMPLINKGEILKYTTGDLRTTLFQSISFGEYPDLTFLLLTKRPSNINKYIPDAWKNNPPSNVMFGTSPSNQETANKLIPQLLKINGKKFLSCEPVLDEIDLTNIKINEERSVNCLSGKQTGDYFSFSDKPVIDWVICGGESGNNKRPFNCDWARKMRDDCKKYETNFFMKQVDKIQEIPEDLMIRQFPNFTI